MESKNPLVKIEQAESIHVELNRLYEIARTKVEVVKFGSNANSSKQLASDVKEAQRLLRSMQLKLTHLKTVGREIPSLNERKKVEINVSSHEKQLNQLQRQLKEGSETVEHEISAEERRSLLLTKDGKQATGTVKTASHEERATRFRDLLAKMSHQVDSGEQSMSSLVHSSSVLGHTQSEYENQKGHIQTGGKLLSKYEQREFTEKILLVFFFLFYFGVVYYILQKRVLLRFWIF